MTEIKTGKEEDINCTDKQFVEFPNLLFGTRKDGEQYFDASAFLEKEKGDRKLTVFEFFAKFDYQINSIEKSYKLKKEDLMVMNRRDGHWLIIKYLCFPFLCYVDQDFSAYSSQIMEELFSTGLVLSDTYIANTARARLPQKVIKQLLDQ